MERERKKEIIAEYKQQRTAGGVYRIFNKETGKGLVKADINLEAVHNRFNFSKKTDTCIFLTLKQDWNKYGSKSFDFEILQEIKCKDEEDTKAFRDRLKKLEEVWKEKFDADKLY